MHVATSTSSAGCFVQQGDISDHLFDCALINWISGAGILTFINLCPLDSLFSSLQPFWFVNPKAENNLHKPAKIHCNKKVGESGKNMSIINRHVFFFSVFHLAILQVCLSEPQIRPRPASKSFSQE